MIETDGDSLTLYFYPSPYGINWESPRTLALTTLRNAASRKGRKIGHVSIEIEQKENGTCNYREHVGMTDVDKTLQRKLLLKEKTGLGILFYSFKGALESAEKLDPEVKNRARRGDLSWVKFQISRETSERIKKYLAEFKSRGGSCHYGLPNRPRFDEGAGCSAFAASFLDVAGILLSDFKKYWTNEISVSEKWIGPPSGNHPVHFHKFLLGADSNHWNFENTPSRKLYFWEPDLMHHWVLDAHHKRHPELQGSPQYFEQKNTKGILFDFRELDAPSEPLWISP